jgi:phosphoribosylanthranilate isomerase
MMMVKVKICGITTMDGARVAVEAGARALGFVFADSRRRTDPINARRIIELLPLGVEKIGVFVNARRAQVEKIADFCGLDLLQFHGQESSDYCLGWRWPVIKAFRVRDVASLAELDHYRVAAYLLDTYDPGTYGGAGRTWRWDFAGSVCHLGNVIIAGGITAGNVSEAIRVLHPAAVDVSSGVETDGQKDPRKIWSFMEIVRRCNNEFTGS